MGKRPLVENKQVEGARIYLPAPKTVLQNNQGFSPKPSKTRLPIIVSFRIPAYNGAIHQLVPLASRGSKDAENVDRMSAAD